jgi:hypothetical protein
MAKQEEKIIEKFLEFTLPLWLPFAALRKLIKEYLEERKKKKER